MAERGVLGAGIVGREQDLEVVCRALAAAGEGPVTCVVYGAPGIGRTSVWQEGLTAARRLGFRVLSCRPAEGDGALAFGGLTDLLDRLPDEALQALPAPQRNALEAALRKRDVAGALPDHLAIHVAVLGLLRALARAAPVVLAVDDAQWLDAPTADVLRHVARRLTEERVALFATAREPAGDHPPFGGGDRGAHRTVRVTLRGLSPRALHRLVRARTGVALSRPMLLRLAEASGGNPHHTLEIAGALAAAGRQPGPGEPLPIPRRLSDQLIGRITGLPPSVREALVAVAFGVRPTVELVREVTATAGGTAGGDVPGDEGGLALAEDAGLIALSDGCVRFTHPLLAVAIHAATPPIRRRHVHRRLAAAVADAGQRAWHLALADERRDEQLAAPLAAAAASAEAKGALARAGTCWELAALRTPDEYRARRTARLAAAGGCLFRAGDAPRGWALLKAAAEAATGPELIAVLLQLADVAHHTGPPHLAAALCARAAGEAAAGGRAQLHALSLVHDAWHGPHDASSRLRRVEAAGQLLAPAQDADGYLRACVTFVAAVFRMGDERGVDHAGIERARALLAPGDRSPAARLARAAWCALAEHLDPRAARGAVATEYALAAERRDEPAAACLLVHLAELDCRLGAWPAAGREARTALELLDHTGGRGRRADALHALGLVAAHLGDLDAAQSAADEGLALACALEDTRARARQLSLLGFLSLTRGDAAAADRHLAEAEEAAGATRFAGPVRHACHADRTEVLAALGEIRQAEALVERLQRAVEAVPYPWLLAVTARCDGIVKMARGELDAAADALGAAVKAHDELPLPFERARTLLVQGRLLRRRKERLAARAVLSEAEAVFAGLGSRPWAERAAAELRRLGLCRARPGELTPTEERVARLAAGGLTNREIAAAACISTKTVEANLSRVYRKLGIRSRKELTGRFLFEQAAGGGRQV